MQGIGIEVPSRALGWTHLGLLGVLLTVSVARPRPVVRTALLGLAWLVTLMLPVLWVGPVWSDADLSPGMPWGLYRAFVLSLAIPFALTATLVVVMARRERAPGLGARLATPPLVYLLGLVVSYPVGFNYSLLYGFIR